MKTSFTTFLGRQEPLNLFATQNVFEVDELISRIFKYIGNEQDKIAFTLVSKFCREIGNECMDCFKATHKISKDQFDQSIALYPNLTFIGYSPHISNETIQDRTNLTALDLSNSAFTRNNVTNEALKKLINLKSLNLTCNYKITNEGIEHLINLTSLNLSYNTKVTDEGLKNLTNLKGLSLSGITRITNQGINNIIYLKELRLDHNYSITDDGLKKMTNLKRLNLTFNEEISDEGIKSLTNLKYLDIWALSKTTRECRKKLPLINEEKRFKHSKLLFM